MSIIKNLLLKILSWFKSRSKLGKVMIITGLIMLVIGLARARSTDDGPEYQFAIVTKGDITQQVTETGEITSANRTDIKNTVTGIVTEVYVENGQFVNRGDHLYYVKSTATEAERSQALASYKSAQATLEQALANQYGLQADMFTEWDQFKELAEGDDYENEDGSPRYSERGVPEFHIPEKEWLEAETEYIAQGQVIAQARANVPILEGDDLYLVSGIALDRFHD